MTTNLTENRGVWPSTDQYTAAHRCPWCKAAPGEDCRRRRGQRKFHLPRIDAGMRHYYRDLIRAPMNEDREPERCYCSITPCPRAIHPGDRPLN